MTDLVKEHGWTSQPRDPAEALRIARGVKDPAPQAVASTSFPATPLSIAVTTYAKKELSGPTFNHSMRVYYYGKNGAVHEADGVPVAIKAHFFYRQSDADTAISGLGLLR